MAPRRIAILGSTGSIGTQALDVIARHPQHLQAEVLTCGHNVELLIQQALQHQPNAVVIGQESRWQEVADVLQPMGIKVYAGEKALASVVEMDSIDLVLTALVGFAGLQPTLRAIAAGKPIALANKETLVVAGHLVTQEANRYRVPIFPVDSEHSAIFQCMMGESAASIEKLILTASGGPFRGKDRAFLESASPAMALKHPNWSMGAKVTIDSASLMNKGLEVIEAYWLFGVPAERIEVVVHPQSIVHSLVQYVDGSIKAQLGLPDMRLPIQYALGLPQRLQASYPRFDFAQYPSLTFEKPDLDNFPNLGLAFQALQQGGNVPCILNAANEIAVEAFLKEQIGFLDMPELIAQAMQHCSHVAQPSLQDLLETDAEARHYTREAVAKLA